MVEISKVQSFLSLLLVVQVHSAGFSDGFSWLVKLKDQDYFSSCSVNQFSFDSDSEFPLVFGGRTRDGKGFVSIAKHGKGADAEPPQTYLIGSNCKAPFVGHFKDEDEAGYFATTICEVNDKFSIFAYRTYETKEIVRAIQVGPFNDDINRDENFFVEYLRNAVIIIFRSTEGEDNKFYLLSIQEDFREHSLFTMTSEILIDSVASDPSATSVYVAGFDETNQVPFLGSLSNAGGFGFYLFSQGGRGLKIQGLAAGQEHIQLCIYNRNNSSFGLIVLKISEVQSIPIMGQNPAYYRPMTMLEGGTAYCSVIQYDSKSYFTLTVDNSTANLATWVFDEDLVLKQTYQSANFDSNFVLSGKSSDGATEVLYYGGHTANSIKTASFASLDLLRDSDMFTSTKEYNQDEDIPESTELQYTSLAAIIAQADEEIEHIEITLFSPPELTLMDAQLVTTSLIS